MQNHRTLALFASIALTLAACGGKSTKELSDDAFAAYGRSDYPTAQSLFQEALKSTDPSSADYLNLKLGEIQATAFIDGAKAQKDFLELAAAQKGKVGVQEYRTVATKLTSAHKIPEAIAVLEDGLKTFPKDDSIKKLGDAIKLEAQRLGDKASLGKLAGLGYL